MNEIDYLALDGHALRLFLAVLQEGSVTEAAERLGMTQSAVSHALKKLRHIARDPLFVRSGRNIVATAHARALAEPARQLLDAMKALASGAQFDPAAARWALTIAANDFQRDLLLPALYRRLSAASASVSLRVIPSALPGAELLRDARCDLVITPHPPSATDVMQKRLLQDSYVCFHDPAMRVAPANEAEYLTARHVTVVYPDEERLNLDKRLEAGGWRREIAISVPNFDGVAAFLRGSTLLASLPRLFAPRLVGMASSPIPINTMPPGLALLPMYLVWHRRFHLDPAHVWLRQQVEAVAEAVMR